MYLDEGLFKVKRFDVDRSKVSSCEELRKVKMLTFEKRDLEKLLNEKGEGVSRLNAFISSHISTGNNRKHANVIDERTDLEAPLTG